MNQPSSGNRRTMAGKLRIYADKRNRECIRLRQDIDAIRQPPIGINLRRQPWSVPRLRGRGEQG
jgi:hypothetical protein